jgi:hypothetical protein
MVTTFAKVIGLILLLVGILGFIPSLTPNNMLFGMFMVGPLHNIIHLVTGLIFAAVGFSENWDASRKVSLIFAAIYAIVTLVGFLSPNGMVLGMQMNMADNVLHLAITVVALLFGMPQRYAMPR